MLQIRRNNVMIWIVYVEHNFMCASIIANQDLSGTLISNLDAAFKTSFKSSTSAAIDLVRRKRQVSIWMGIASLSLSERIS